MAAAVGEAYKYYWCQEGPYGGEEAMAHQDDEKVLLGQGPGLAHQCHDVKATGAGPAPWSTFKLPRDRSRFGHKVHATSGWTGGFGRPERPGESGTECHKGRAAAEIMPEGKCGKGAIDKRRPEYACTRGTSQEQKKRGDGRERENETRESGLETPCGRTLHRRTLRTLAQAGARLRPAKQPLRSVLPTQARSMTRPTGDFHPTLRRVYHPAGRTPEPRAQHFSAQLASARGADTALTACLPTCLLLGAVGL